jgi:presenilin-like A22 family membrane protease
MKHSIKITLILLAIFLLAQFIGIGVLYNYIDVEKSAEEGKTVFEELPIGERPPIEEATSFIWILLAVLIGTVILLLLIKYKVYFLWKIWFLMAVVLALTISWAAFIKETYALFLALAFGFWKIFRPNVLVQNFTELFIYGGLAAIFAPLFNLWSVIVLLFLISGYDAYAVWKSKHMITLAKSQAKARIFAGLLIPYKLRLRAGKKGKKVKRAGKKIRTAILGGGDIGFPLIFTGVILKVFGLWQSLVIPIFSGAALLFLLLKGDEDKFYPAMPFITAGCLIGLGVVLLLGLL